MLVSNSLLASLARIANLFYDTMSQKVSSGYPRGNSEYGTIPIEDATSIEEAKPTDSGASIDIVIDLKKAPYAAAYEWGSGIHRTRGSPGTYPITGHPYLAFFWEKIGKRVVLPQVNHPGVEAKPFIVPSMEETLPQAMQIVGKSLKDELLTRIRNGGNVIEVKIR